MKKINKKRMVTENDVRNLHYIHENEELIPAGVTELQEDDITSVEAVMENDTDEFNRMYDSGLYDNMPLPDTQEKTYWMDTWAKQQNKRQLWIDGCKILKRMGYPFDGRAQVVMWAIEELAKKQDPSLRKDILTLLAYYFIFYGRDFDYDGYAMTYGKEQITESQSEFMSWAKDNSEQNKQNFTAVGAMNSDEIEQHLNDSVLYDGIDLSTKDGVLKAIDKVTDNHEFQELPYLINHYMNEFGSDGTFATLVDTYENLRAVNEAEVRYNIDFWVDKKDPNDTKEEANNILRMLGYQTDPSQVDLEEIIKHFDVDYDCDADYTEYIVTLLGYYYLMFGRTEFYKDYAHKYGVAMNESLDTNVRFDEFLKLLQDKDESLYTELMKQLQAVADNDIKAAYNVTRDFLKEKGVYDEYAPDFEAIPVNEDDMDEFGKLIASDVWKRFKADWSGADVYDVAMEAISYVDTLPQMVDMLKKVLAEYDMLEDYESGLNDLLKSQAVNESEFEKFLYMNNISSNIVNDKGAFEDKIRYFIDQDKSNGEFHEAVLLMLNAYKKQYGETDFYRDVTNQGYSLDDLKHEGRLRFFCQKYLSKNGFDLGVLNSQSSLSDTIQRLVDGNKDYNQICALLNYYKEHYGMDDFVRSLTDKNNDDPFGNGKYYDIDSYGRFETINEYTSRNTYEPNNGDVEDLYYIQPGDIILVHHKDYGELQCKVKKVDADKNKVYFATVERGIMGVCGFDKIHGIELVDECQKKPMFVQTKYIRFPDGGICYMCYTKVGNRYVEVYCTFGMSLDNGECIKLLNMSEDEFGIIDNIMAESDSFEDAKNRVYNSGLISL